MPVKLKDLVDALALSNDESQAFLCKTTGELFWRSDFDDEPDELPDDIGDESKYFELPSRQELGLGKPLVLDFVRQHLPDDLAEVQRMFNRRGAYRHFRDFLVRRQARERWYEFEASAAAAALKGWCEANEIDVAE